MPAAGSGAATALQVERERERVGGELDRPVRQHRDAPSASRSRRPPRRRRARWRRSRRASTTSPPTRSSRCARVGAARLRAASWAISSSPSTPASASGVVGEDPDGGREVGRGRRGTCSASQRRAWPASATRTTSAISSTADGQCGGDDRRECRRCSALRHRDRDRWLARGAPASGRGALVAAGARSACSSRQRSEDRLQRTPARSRAHASSLPVARSGRLGSSTSGARRCSAQIAAARAAPLLRSRGRRGERRSARCPTGAGRSRRARGGRGSTPLAVAGSTHATCVALRERDLVGLAGERAAVDHGQRVALARVLEQQLDALARARAA